MTRRERNRLDTLRRRATHLERALADWRGGDPSRARAEQSAIRWAIRVIEAASDVLLARVRADEALCPDCGAPAGPDHHAPTRSHLGTAISECESNRISRDGP